MTPAGSISYSTAHMLPHSAEIATNSRWRLKDTPALQTTYEQQSHHLVYHRSSVRIIVSTHISLGGRKLSIKIDILWTCWLFQKCVKTKCKLQYSRSYTSRLSNVGGFKRRWQLRQKEQIYTLFAAEEVRITNKWARGLEYVPKPRAEHVPRPRAEGRTRDLWHSFSQCGPHWAGK